MLRLVPPSAKLRNSENRIRDEDLGSCSRGFEHRRGRCNARRVRRIAAADRCAGRNAASKAWKMEGARLRSADNHNHMARSYSEALAVAAKLAVAALIIIPAACEEGEFANQAEAIARHGPTMKAILKKHPSQRIVVHYEPGAVIDRPHELIYDPTDRTSSRVIQAFRDRGPEWVRNCNITGERIQPSFFDLTLDCH